MKINGTLTALLLATLLCAAPARAGSYQDVLDTPALKSPLAAKTLMVGVATAGKRIVAVGWRGHIVYSDDRGKSWLQASVPVSSDLVAVHFPTPQQGWAVGHDGVVLHSSDGGATWARQFDGRAAARVMSDAYASVAGTTGAKGAEAGSIGDEVAKMVSQGADKPFLDVWFENETTGFIVGAFSLIFATHDGGRNWTPWYDRIDNPKRFHLYAIRPIGGELYLTAEQGSVFKLDRKSQRFQPIRTPYSGTFFGITGKAGALVAYGMRGNAFRSRDGGASWQKVETGVQGGLVGGTVTDRGRIVLVSQGGQLLVSGDDGASFMPVRNDQAVPAAGLASVEGDLLALAGQRGVQVQAIK